jgi:hypothetical protein
VSVPKVEVKCIPLSSLGSSVTKKLAKTCHFVTCPEICLAYIARIPNASGLNSDPKQDFLHGARTEASEFGFLDRHPSLGGSC